MLPTGYVVQQVFNALLVGSFYSLLAVSYALVHGLTNRIVLSFGDMAMFCAFASLYAALAAVTLGAHTAAMLAAGLAGSMLSAAALGLFSLKAVFAPLMTGRSQTLLIASVSLGLVLQETMRLQSGGREQWLEPILGNAAIEGMAGGFMIRISAMQMLIIGGTAAVLLAMSGALRWTKLGRLWRACSEDAPLARLIGIDVGKVTSLTFVIAAVYAGTSLLELPSSIHHLVFSTFVVALFIQFALWADRIVSTAIAWRLAPRKTKVAMRNALSLIQFVVRVGVWSLAFLLIFENLGFDVTALVAGLGIGGIAVALAARACSGTCSRRSPSCLTDPSRLAISSSSAINAAGWKRSASRPRACVVCRANKLCAPIPI